MNRSKLEKYIITLTIVIVMVIGMFGFSPKLYAEESLRKMNMI